MPQYKMDWNPQKTWIFAVGILEWEYPDVWAPFPDAVEGRFDEKLVEFLRSQQVPDEQIVYLQDADATLEQIQQNLAELLYKTDEEALLILYFAGHGDWDSDSGEYYFINYDANPEDRDNYWTISSIFDDIESNFNGSKVLLLADCCFSGGLIDELKQRETEIAYACVTSAYSHNSSTGEWTFTASLLKGLLGDPVVDLDGDRLVSLYDFARYAELEMAFIEGQKSMFFTTGDFDSQMVLAKVSGDRDAGSGERVEVEYEGEWYKAKVLETNDEQIRIQYVQDYSEEWVSRDVEATRRRRLRLRPYEPEMFAVGEQVEVEYQEEWYPATVKKAWYGLHFISYDDYSEEWEEWIGGERIRLPQ